MTTLTQSNTQYNYTAAQNRTGLYARNGLNQYTQIDGETLGYDTNGNLDQDRDAGGTLIDYTYDLENRLVQVDGPTAAALEYDPLGRLSRLTLSANVTQFLYDGDALVAEYLNGALTRRYVHGDQVDEPLVLYTNGSVSAATRRFLHADHQGSVIAWSDNIGAAVQKNAYDPYGIPAPGNSGRFGYTGQTWIPELGLNYYKARFYSPTLGRFLQTDPIFYEDDMNLYAYLENDPGNGADPTGNQDAPTIGERISGSPIRQMWDRGSEIARNAADKVEKVAEHVKVKVSGAIQTPVVGPALTGEVAIHLNGEVSADGGVSSHIQGAPPVSGKVELAVTVYGDPKQDNVTSTDVNVGPVSVEVGVSSEGKTQVDVGVGVGTKSVVPVSVQVKGEQPIDRDQ